jgi:hypothetical protein
MQLLNKKYALPHRVIDAVANHFGAFNEEELALPVIWHQALLTFVQRCDTSPALPAFVLLSGRALAWGVAAWVCCVSFVPIWVLWRCGASPQPAAL